MESTAPAVPIGARFGQVAWVVPDIRAAEAFFRDALGVPGFANMEHPQARDLDGTYRGRPADFAFHLYMAYSNGALIELIQPVAGESPFQEFLAARPQGGVQDVAHMVPESAFDEAVAQLTRKGHPVVLTLTLPVARVAFFDTTAEIGVMTEIIGVTAAGDAFVGQLRSGAF